ncbi:hypothetical protein A8F95_05505 [Bacillus wudalianchiensis]|uniref:Uncharacterized protein n=1 Tax=Pseudobacillus wudalianchiensis TaxID=1743143 RepID=A0A1B9AY66_9BACI|nr:hypothetical protein A8F95_05505 [Bacillus wudalianchiensis]
MRDAIGNAFTAKNGALTVNEIQERVNAIVSFNEIAIAVGQPNTITVDILNKATGLTTALIQNEEAYRKAIESGASGMWSVYEVQDIVDMINVVNAVQLMTDNSVTTPDADAIKPVLQTPVNSNGVTFTFAGNTNNGASASFTDSELTITRGPGGVLSITVSVEAGFYWEPVEYEVVVPESGAISISKDTKVAG